MRRNQLLVVIVVVVLVVMLAPAWPYSAGWGYYPSGGVGLLGIVLVVLLLLGYI